MTEKTLKELFNDAKINIATVIAQIPEQTSSGGFTQLMEKLPKSLQDLPGKCYEYTTVGENGESRAELMAKSNPLQKAFILAKEAAAGTVMVTFFAALGISAAPKLLVNEAQANAQKFLDENKPKI
jgi:hypothetical protein